MEREELDERCDQWALASLTYEMLTRGENPFRAASVDEAIDAIYDAEIVIPSLCMEGIGEELDDAIFRALDPDREGRYPSVHAFARDAKPALGNPKQGTKKLAEVVSRAVGVEAQDETDAFSEDEALEGEDAQPSSPYPLNLWRKNSKKNTQGSGAFRKPRTSGAVPANSAAIEDTGSFEDSSFETGEGFSAGRKSRRGLVMRILALLASLLVSSVALSNFSLVPGWDSPLFWGMLALVGIIAFAIPHVGALFSFALLGLALVNNGAYLVGSLVVVAAFVWWFFVGKWGSHQANAALLPTCASSVGLGSLTPLITAYFLNPFQAFCTTAFAAFIALVLAGFGSVSITSWDVLQFGSIHMWTEVEANMLTAMQNAVTWAIIASWLVSAPLASLLFQRETPVANVLAVLCATAITGIVPSVVSVLVLSHSADPIYILLTICSGAIACAVVLLFPPRH
jgi:hypothetical protein